MRTTLKPALAGFNRGKLKAGMVCTTALLSFAAGSLVTARLMRPAPVRAGGNRVFELMIYHTMPGKEPALESIFRDVAQLQAKHKLKVVGFWVPNHDPAWNDTFIYLVAHPSLEDAKANWKSLHADPLFKPYRKSAEPLIQKVDDKFMVDEVYMRPTDFSAMR